MKPPAVHRSQRKKAAFLLAAALAVQAGLGIAGQPGLTAGVENGKVTISGRIAGSLTPEAVKALSGGTPVTFTYEAQVMRQRPLIWDSTVRQTVVKRLLKYDALRKSYLAWEKRDEGGAGGGINFSEELKTADYKPAEAPQATAGGPKEQEEPKTPTAKESKPVVMDPLILPSQQEMEEWISSTGKLDMGPAEGLTAGAKYYAQIRVKVKSVNQSPPMRFILFFLSFLDFDTEWLRSNTFEPVFPAKGGEAQSAPARKPEPGPEPVK